MRALIVEDDVISREILQKILNEYGDCDLAFDGREGIEIFKHALKEARPYDLICMDIMMPELSGLDALHRIRQIEKEHGVNRADEAKVIMTTALSGSKEVIDALYKGGASAYFVKPIELDAFVQELEKIGLIEKQP